MTYDSAVVVPLPPDETFALITEPERLRRWNCIAARVDLRAGGEYRWTIVPGAYATGFIREVEPGKRVVFGWGPEPVESDEPDSSTVTITLEPVADGTQVRLRHDGLPAELEADHAKGWDHYLDRLVTLGAAGQNAPDLFITEDDYLGDLTELKAAEASLAIVQTVLRALTAADLERSSPCTEFTVQGVIDHLSGSIVGIGGAAGVTVEKASSGNVEVDVANLSQPVLEGWHARGTDGTVNIGFELPAANVLGILAVEYLVHAWDIATATGQKIEVNDVLPTYVLSLSQRVVNPELRDKVGFDPEIVSEPGATPMEKLVNFTGRAA